MILQIGKGFLIFTTTKEHKNRFFVFRNYLCFNINERHGNNNE